MFYTLGELAELGADVRLGVIGNPIAHSKSPQMQQAALNDAGQPYRYVRLLADTDEGGFEAMLAALAARGFLGVNVTVPFKKKAFAAAVQADALSTLCGAANTLVRKEDGWHCHNTDGPGFERAIQELSGRPLADMRVVLLGACGGAGSALAAQCALSHCRALTLVNRPRPELEQMAATLAPHYGAPIPYCHFGTTELRTAVAQADLIINATSLGLKEGDSLPLPAEWLNPGQIVYDIVTHHTPLQQAAAERGCMAADGLGMLLWQGAIAFEHWFGQLPSVESMRAALIGAESSK
jgi:shikimate dehydrogenase